MTRPRLIRAFWREPKKKLEPGVKLLPKKLTVLFVHLAKKLKRLLKKQRVAENRQDYMRR